MPNRTEGDVLPFAYTSGVECTLGELVSFWAVGVDGLLNQLLCVRDRLASLHLELLPSVMQGDLGTPRVMRALRADTLVQRIPTLTKEESGTVEFKESLYVDMNRLRNTSVREVSEGVTKAALKSLAAFVNGEGGTLLIGVDDAGVVCDGIAQDLTVKNCNKDRFELGFRDLMRTKFVGLDMESHARVEWAEVEGDLVLGVDLVPSPRPVFLEMGGRQEYFVRRGNRTVSLSFLEFYEQAVPRYIGNWAI